jgi:hypothetical protein
MNGRARFARVRPLAAALLVVLGTAAQAAAQISVIPVSELRFGTLTAGIPTSVAPGDLSGSAQIDVTAQGRITIVVVLPTTLTSATGATVPVEFSAVDGRYQVGNRPPRAFDPRSPVSLTVSRNTDGVVVWIGGTALTSAVQPPGSYSGVISLQVFPGG